MPICSSGICRSAIVKATSVSSERREHVAHRRRHLADDQARARDGQRQQRLERFALALAGRRVDREMQAARQRREQQEIRQDAEHERGPARRRRDVELVDDERPKQARVDAVRDEPQRADLLPIAVDGAAQPADAARGAILRAVDDERDARGAVGAEVLAERFVDDEDDVVRARGDELRGLLDVLRCRGPRSARCCARARRRRDSARAPRPRSAPRAPRRATSGCARPSC